MTAYQACRVTILSGDGDVRIRCPVTGQERTWAECARCDRFLAWEETWLLCRLPCSACADRHDVAIQLDEAVFCSECRDRACKATDDDELGGSD